MDTIDRTRPPQPGPPKDVAFPDYFETALPNGMKLIVYERHEFPTVTVSLVARGGTACDGATPGLASMTSELLTKGAGGRDAVRLAEDIESLGGSLAAGAGWDSSNAGVTILSRHFGEAMDILADVVRRPTFPADELDAAREKRIAAIMQRKANPSTLALNRFHQAVYGKHPYASPQEGTEDSIRALERDAMAAFHHTIFQPANTFLIAVGDTDPAWMTDMCTRLYGDWSNDVPVPDAVPAPAMNEGIAVHVVDRPSAVQSSIVVGHVGIDRRNPDYIPVTVMNTLFGGYFGARLNMNLREQKGYTYGAHSRFDGRMAAGPFSAGADVRNDVTDAAIEEILKEMQRLRDEDVSTEELANVQRYITGSFPLQIETPLHVAQRIVSIEMFQLGKTYYNTYNSRVMAVTPDDIRRVARTYLHPDNARIVAAGRGSLLQNTLARFGTVDVFHADGHPLPTHDIKGD